MPSPGKPSQVPLANRPKSATRSKSRSPVAASAKPRSARRTRKQMMLGKLDELRGMIEENCDLPAGAPKTPARRKSLAASVVPTLVPYTASANPFNSPPQSSAAPATMVPMTLGNAFAKPATKAKTPKVAAAVAASAMPASAMAVPVSKRGGPKPSLRANQEGSWNKFLKNWMAAHPGMKRPDAMKAAGENWKAFKTGKTPAAAGLGAAAAGAAAGAAAAAVPLSALGEAEEEEEEEEEREAEDLGLL